MESRLKERYLLATMLNETTIRPLRRNTPRQVHSALPHVTKRWLTTYRPRTRSGAFHETREIWTKPTWSPKRGLVLQPIQ